METQPTYRSKDTLARLSALLLAVCLLAVFGCENQPTDPGMATSAATEKAVASTSLDDADMEIIEGPMQISPHMINLQSVGAGESIRAIVGLAIPAGYYLTDYDFTLSFNDEDVTVAYDCYYCYVDNNLIISFKKSEILESPVTLEYVNTEAIAAVNGYFRVESDDDGYDTSLSTTAVVEIINPAHTNQTNEPGSTAPDA